jgi:hypothetical protein
VSVHFIIPILWKTQLFKVFPHSNFNLNALCERLRPNDNPKKSDINDVDASITAAFLDGWSNPSTLNSVSMFRQIDQRGGANYSAFAVVDKIF